jgi:hypothetical protein
MSSTRFSVHLDTSHQGQSHPSKDSGEVADSLTGIHSPIVKCLFVVKRSCIHKEFLAVPAGKNPEDLNTSWRVDATYLPVILSVNGNMSSEHSCMYHISVLTVSGIPLTPLVPS